jgi:hypothetical protein
MSSVLRDIISLQTEDGAEPIPPSDKNYDFNPNYLMSL